MVNKKTIQIYRHCGNSTYVVRVPVIILFGFCLFWKIKFEGTREECTEFCVKEYNIPWWQWPWNQHKIILGHS